MVLLNAITAEFAEVCGTCFPGPDVMEQDRRTADKHRPSCPWRP